MRCAAKLRKPREKSFKTEVEPILRLAVSKTVLELDEAMEQGPDREGSLRGEDGAAQSFR